MTTTPVQNDLLLSAAAYARWVDPGDDPTELVRGRVVREPRLGVRHGAVQAELASLLISHVRESDAGTVLTESGVILSRDPDTVRGPDVAFYARGRLPDPPTTSGCFPETRAWRGRRSCRDSGSESGSCSVGRS
jgi:hypothetical protein